MFTKKIMAVILSIVMLIGTAAGFASAKEFNDVKEDSWFKAAVDYVVERDLFNGTGKGNFSPNKQASKGMIITVLARMAGTDVDTGATDGNYSDVDYSLWYGPAIAWAYRMGIIGDEGKFEPNSMLTRENMAVIIANFIDAFDLTYEEKTSEEPQYTDYDKISEEAKDAVALTYKAGIFKGNKNGTFKPQSGLTRAELATVIMRLAKLTEESGEVSGIAFDRKTVKVTVDDTVKAAVNAVPKEIENVSYTYTSADTNIATVDEEGNIKGIAVGETTVTVTTVNGLTASCKVIVEEPKPASFSVDSWYRLNEMGTANMKKYYPNGKVEDTIYVSGALRGDEGANNADMVHGHMMEDDKIPNEYWDEYTPYGYPIFQDKILITDDELNNETPGYDGKYRFTSADESIIKINEYTGRIYMYATSDAYVDENDSCVLSFEKKSTQVTITNIEDGTSITINVALVGKDQYIQSDPNYKARYCAEMFRLVNEKRVENGLPELEYIYEVQGYENHLAENLAQKFTHQHFGFECILKTGVGYRIYKDIHITQRSPEEAAKDDFDMWMNSDAHRKILVENVLSAPFDKYFVCSFYWATGTRYAMANILGNGFVLNEEVLKYSGYNP